MAEKNAATQVESAPAAAAAPSGQKPTLFIILALVNMLVVLGVGAMLFLGQKKKDAEPKIDDVIKGEAETQEAEKKSQDFIGQLIPLETFLVNLSGSRGNRLMKINMELEVDNAEVATEIDRIKPKIRDIIIIILSSKSYLQISSREGKDILRSEIKDQVNLFLTKGQIKRVYFTEFIAN